VFVSDTFIRACARLGVSVQVCCPRTSTGKGIVEVIFDAAGMLTGGWPPGPVSGYGSYRWRIGSWSRWPGGSIWKVECSMSK
jgi:hypothetical protein